MDSVSVETRPARPTLDGLPREILTHTFSLVFEPYTPRLCKLAERYDRWKAIRFPRSSHFIISKTVHVAAQQARLDCFSGIVEHDMSWRDRYRMDPIYIRLRSRVIEFLGSRIQRHVILAESTPWIPVLMQSIEPRLPVAIEFRVKRIISSSLYKDVPIPQILNGEIDRELEAFMNSETPEPVSEYGYRTGFAEYPWLHAPKNVEVYLTVYCPYSVAWLLSTVPVICSPFPVNFLQADRLFLEY